MSDLPSWARVGAKVVYIDDSPGRLVAGAEVLRVGSVYVLRSVTDEFAEPACQVHGDRLCHDEFLALARFRPLITQEDDIAAHFRQHLDVREPVEA